MRSSIVWYDLLQEEAFQLTVNTLGHCECSARFVCILFSEKPFTAIGPIYFEYGSLVITFNTPKAATAAVQRLQNANYEDKKLIVLCLPNVQVC